MKVRGKDGKVYRIISEDICEELHKHSVFIHENTENLISYANQFKEAQCHPSQLAYAKLLMGQVKFLSDHFEQANYYKAQAKQHKQNVVNEGLIRASIGRIDECVKQLDKVTEIEQCSDLIGDIDLT